LSGQVLVLQPVISRRLLHRNLSETASLLDPNLV
jgi:hypothetical protein